MVQGILLLPEKNRDVIYGTSHAKELERLLDLQDCCSLCGDIEALKPYLSKTEVICSGWGMMKLDREFLSAAPRLKAVFYGAGSVRGFLTDEFWKRDILLTTAMDANAVPVAETTVALMTLSLKKAFLCHRQSIRKSRWERPKNIKGLYGAWIGLIGMGTIGRKVAELLRHYDVNVLCYDPYLDKNKARQYGCTPAELDELFSTCDVVSLHAPNLPSTRHMIRARHFGRMKEGAVFINTARGQIVHQEEMIDELLKGRIFACLDVTCPEPPEPDSPLFTLDNVFLTPHIAGSMGEECKRMGGYVVEEVRRFLRNEPPMHPVTEEMLRWMA